MFFFFVKQLKKHYICYASREEIGNVWEATNQHRKCKLHTSEKI